MIPKLNVPSKIPVIIMISHHALAKPIRLTIRVSKALSNAWTAATQSAQIMSGHKGRIVHPAVHAQLSKNALNSPQKTNAKKTRYNANLIIRPNTASAKTTNGASCRIAPIVKSVQAICINVSMHK